ncbi:MAG: cohesin domain-containing protein [Candidatus Bathyarchaeota archaeon]|nr:cohesin domain-containing protein [Candidatus Bathyarchaeota archaeon]
MKKTMVRLMFLILLTSSFFIQVGFSQPATVVKVEPSTTSPTLGQPFTVTITLNNVQNLYGLEINLNWDSSVLEATNVEAHVGVESFADGVLHESSNSPPIFIAQNNLTQSEGEYRLVVTSTAPAQAFSGSGTIAKITFKPISLGSSNLDVQSELYDYPPSDRDPRISMAIDHTHQDSAVTVTENNGVTQTNAPTSAANTPSPTNASPTSTAPTPTSSNPMTTVEPQNQDSIKIGTPEVMLVLIVLVVLLIVVGVFLMHRRNRAH